MPVADPTEASFEPTSSDLIAQAVASGDIDESTALLYHTRLLFGDPRHPEQFVGAAETHDVALISELRAALDDLPTASAL